MRFSLRICTGKHAGRELPIRGPRFLIGSADNCHLKLHASQVSSYHCELFVEDHGIWVRDLGGGALVGGKQIVDRCRLHQGDQLQIGPLRFEALIQDAPLKGNSRAPDEGEILNLLSEPVERPVAAVPERSDLASTQSPSSQVPPGAHAAVAGDPEPGDTSELANDVLKKLYKCKPSFKTAAPGAVAARPSKSPQEADAVAPSPEFAPEALPGASVAAPKRRVIAIALPRWLFTADGQLNANVMFALGVWAGIGLCAAFFAILTISRR